MEWFFNLDIIVIKLYKIWYLNLDKALLFPRNQAICLKNWKLWRAPTTTKFDIFCWNFTLVSYITMSTKGFSGFLLLLLFRSWVVNKNVKNECVETSSFLIFANSARSKQINLNFDNKYFFTLNDFTVMIINFLL